MNTFDKLMGRIARTLKLIAAVWLFALSIFILTEVIARLINVNVAGLKEIIANSIVVIAFLQLPYTVRIAGMLRAEVIDELVSHKTALILKKFGYFLSAILFAAVAYAGWAPMLRAWASGEYEGEGGFRVVTYPVRTVIVFCSALGAINFLLLALGLSKEETTTAAAI